MSKIISGSFVLSAVVDGENAVAYEMIDNGSYFRYNPNTKKVDMKVLGTLYKIEGTKHTPMVGYQIFINDDGNIINDNANDSNYLTTKTDGSFSYTADSDWVDLLSQSTKIHAGFYTNDGLAAVLNIQKITDGENGMKGERGAPLRVTEWEDGWIYYNGKGANDPYTDVVKYGNYWYLCKTSHRSNQVNHPSGTTENTSNWEAATQFDMIATKVLLAANAHIDLLGSNTIEVKDSSGETTAGMSGGDGVQLWAGGQQESANFRVKKNGDVHVAGYVTAKALYRGFDHVYPVKQRLIKYSDNDAILKEWIFLVSNRGESNPSQADFIIITGDTKDWSASQDASNYHDDDYSDYIKEQGFNNTSCGNVFIPNPTTVEGKEVTIINTVKKNDDSNSSCDILLYAKGGGNNSFYYYRGTTGVSEDLEYISLASIRKIHLVSGRMGTEYAQWIVLDVDEK